MAEQLKTLKDFDYEEGLVFTEMDYDGTAVDLDILRSEARKWLKHYNNVLDNENGGHDYEEILGKISWISHFFNLEDDN